MSRYDKLASEIWQDDRPETGEPADWLMLVAAIALGLFLASFAAWVGTW